MAKKVSNKKAKAKRITDTQRLNWLEANPGLLLLLSGGNWVSTREWVLESFTATPRITTLLAQIHPNAWWENLRSLIDDAIAEAETTRSS